ncbi:MAG: glycoside hydrolase family 5 protein [Planctomycetes bacterium]|nr:glycoside hydrolase family 5 protein [Planctomycetota bacterium]
MKRQHRIALAALICVMMHRIVECFDNNKWTHKSITLIVICFFTIPFVYATEVAAGKTIISKNKTDIDDQTFISQYWKEQEIIFNTMYPGNLFYPGDIVTANVHITPCPLKTTKQLRAYIKVFDAYNREVAPIQQISLNEENGFAGLVNLPGKPGYYQVEIVVSDETNKNSMETRYAVIPAHFSKGINLSSPFGVNTHFNQGWSSKIGEIVKRSGIAWIRDGEAGPGDKAAQVAKDNDLCYMACFTAWRKKLADKFRETLKKDPDFNRQWDYAEQIKWHQEYTKKYHNYVHAYDIMNEPHGTWGAVLGGSWRGGQWLVTFADYAKHISRIIRKADPGEPIIWEDIDRLMWYDDFHKYNVADFIDVISPHTYNLHRKNPYPEDQPTIAQQDEWLNFLRKHNLSWQIWSGEVGFSSYELNPDNPSMFYSPHTELHQANMLVRMMVVQLAWGVKRIFWYDFMNDGWNINNPEHNFGIIRKDQLPKPAIVAYAYLIYRFKNIKTLIRFNIKPKDNVFAYCIMKEGQKEPTLIIWAKEGQETVDLFIVSNITKVAVTNIFGTSLEPISAVNHNLHLILKESPIYIEGFTIQDLR